MLNTFGDDIWISDGPEVVAAAGFHYPTRMAIIRLDNNDLFVWSPVQWDPALKAQIDFLLGRVKHLVAPNLLHHLYLGEWKSRLSRRSSPCAAGASRKAADLVFDRDLAADGQQEWSHEIDHVTLAGNVITTEIVFFHHKSGTVIFTDLLQQLPSSWFSGWRAIVARLDLMTGSEPAVPRKFRLAFTRRRLAKELLARILAWPAKKVLLAHGTPVEKDAPAFLRRAFQWLNG